MSKITITIDSDDINITAPETGEIERKTAKVLTVITEMYDHIGEFIPVAIRDVAFDAVKAEIIEIMKG